MNSGQILVVENRLAPSRAKKLIDKILALEESDDFDVKRVSGKMVQKALQTVCAFSNTRGGVLALGLEDPTRARGRMRLYGIDENPEAVDELLQVIRTRLWSQDWTKFFTTHSQQNSAIARTEQLFYWKCLKVRMFTRFLKAGLGSV